MLAAKARGGGPRSGERNRLFLQRSQGVSQRRARYRHQPGERLAQLQNQENRARGRKGKQRKAGEHRHVQRREQAKACKDDYEPKRQNCQKRRRNKIVGFDKQQKAGLREVIAQLRSARLQRALQIVLRRQPLYFEIDPFSPGVRFIRSCDARLLFAPELVGKRTHCAAHLFTDGPSFWTVLGKDVVEQDQISGDLLNLRVLRVERTLCRRDKQAEDQRRYCRYQPDAEPHSVLRVVAEVMLRQSLAQQRAKKDASQRQNKNYAGK